MNHLDAEKDFDFANGEVLLVDKPLDWTSFHVVNKVRHLVKVKKVGHAGTLDPLATGLLIICTGKFTKRIEQYQAAEKEYIGSFMLGQTTPTYDLESTPSDPVSVSHLSAADLERAADGFRGEIEQLPPAHSAVKIKGKKAYEHARAGKPVELKPRKVTISTFELVEVALPLVRVRVICSKGTYIRSLAHDFGAALGVGGHLSALRRTRIGGYEVAQAWQIADFEQAVRTWRGRQKEHG